MSWDHPRVCGEDASTVAQKSTSWGPPPRMRGRHRDGARVMVHCGTTPAYAGKTWRTGRKHVQPGDHPRVCGEDNNGNTDELKELGPPPRMRGRLPKGHFPFLALQDHPRVCGEDPLRSTVAPWRKGPPPRMRGRHSLTWSNVAPLAILDTTASVARQTPQAPLNRSITVTVWRLRTVHDWLPYFDLARLPGWLVTPLVGRQGRNGAHDEVLDLFQCRPFSGSGQG